MRVLVLLCILVLPTGAVAQTSEMYAKMAVRLSDSFTCAAWAYASGKNDAGNQHFKSGIEYGEIYFDALIAGKIKDSDLKVVPTAVLKVSVDAPKTPFTTDFLLGIVWQNITDWSASLDGTPSQRYVDKRCAVTY